MALTEQVQLDIQNAQRQIDTLERQIQGLSTPVNVPVDIDADTADFDRIARALNISEDEARQLATTVGRSVNEAAQLDNELREVARALGLSEREASQFAREMQRVEKATDQTTQGMLRFGTRGASVFTNLRGSLLGLLGAFGAIQGARAFLSFANDAIDAASDLEESTSKAQVVFGEFFGDIEQFASTAPQALGLANAAALEFSGTFGNLFTALGLSQEAAADLAPQIVQLGADLASFNNIEVTEALDKLRAGLVGEAEPLRALGVNLTAAATAAKAVELGLAGSTAEVSEAAKVQARYALILEQTTTAQGDFARTSEGIANQQRTLNAELENLRANVGKALLPLFAELVAGASDLLPKLEEMIPALAGAAEGLFSMVTPVFELLGPLAQLVALFGDLQAAAQDLQQQDDPFSQLAGANLERLTTGALPSFLNQLEEFQFFLRTGVRTEDVTQGIDSLVEAVERGSDPAVALTRFLGQLSEQGTITGEVLSQVVRNLDLTAAEAASIRIAAREGVFGDLSPQEIDAINKALAEFIDIDISTRLARGGRAARNASRDIDDLAFSAQVGAGYLQELNERSQLPLGEIMLENARATREFEEALGGLVGAVQFDTSDAVDELELLLEVTNKAGDEVPATMEQMIDDLQAQADRLARLEAATLILEALGLPLIAAELRSQGPDAADAAEEFISDLASAFDAERILQEGGNPGEELIDLIGQAIEQGNLTPEMLTMLETITSSEVQQAAINEATELAGLVGQALIDAFSQVTDIRVPVNLIPEITFQDIPGAPGSPSFNPDLAIPGGGGSTSTRPPVNNTQVFSGFTPSSTDLARANQSISTLVN